MPAWNLRLPSLPSWPQMVVVENSPNNAWAMSTGDREGSFPHIFIISRTRRGSPKGEVPYPGHRQDDSRERNECVGKAWISKGRFIPWKEFARSWHLLPLLPGPEEVCCDVSQRRCYAQNQPLDDVAFVEEFLPVPVIFHKLFVVDFLLVDVNAGVILDDQ